ncbi:MAG: glycoside hydrolase family 127 protein [Clostridia bacterium]
MPSAIAYRRTPLVDSAFVALSDAAVHTDGVQEQLTKRALSLVDVTRMTPLDAVLATKLGGYTELPPLPDVEAAVELLPAQPERFIQILRAASMLCAMSRDKQGMLRVLSAMRAFGDALPQISEEALFVTGADALRLTVDLYRRTGQAFLLSVLESLRAQLPDVSGVMHVFPFQREFRLDQAATSPEEQEYHERMRRIATGKLTADALSMTAFLAQYSGSGRDAAASRVGMNALTRYHGMPCGAFAADPYLAGRDPARAVELPALCAQIEAAFDALCFTGELSMADHLEELLQNALVDMLPEGGVRALEPTNRLAGDDSCEVSKPEPEDVSAILRALYALRKSTWLAKDDDTLAYMMPVAGGCLTRLGGVPVRFTARVSGVFQKQISIRVECKQPVACTLLLHVPAYAQAATVSVNGGKAQAAPSAELYSLNRTFQNGDEITLCLSASPRVETGYRGSVSIHVGSTLMALALPNEGAAWRYAVLQGAPITPVEENGLPYALVAACEAPEWKEKSGFILPPPQGVALGAAYELTLIPYAGTNGRIAAFPCAASRA